MCMAQTGSGKTASFLVRNLAWMNMDELIGAPSQLELSMSVSIRRPMVISYIMSSLRHLSWSYQQVWAGERAQMLKEFGWMAEILEGLLLFDRHINKQVLLMFNVCNVCTLVVLHRMFKTPTILPAEKNWDSYAGQYDRTSEGHRRFRFLGLTRLVGEQCSFCTNSPEN